MLIRWVKETDLPAWLLLATEVSRIFQHPADMGADPEFASFAESKTTKREALTAMDYRSGSVMGVIVFSRTHNRISWFAVSETYRNKGVGGRLLKTALRHLDPTRPITVETFPEGYEPGIPAKKLYRSFGFTETESNLVGPHNVTRCKMTLTLPNERRGSSFHYQYPAFMKSADEKSCPVCNGALAPSSQVDIERNDNVFIVAENPGQGRLFGKMYVMPKKHFVHFEDMETDEMIRFMSEVKRVGKALRRVTGAEKVNYEMHSNSGAHLHIHLFPRYLDDDFPSAPIDYRICEPSPYECEDEFYWFVEQMRLELQEN